MNTTLPRRGPLASLVLVAIGVAFWSGSPTEAAKYPRGTSTESALAAVAVAIRDQDHAALEKAMTTVQRIEQDSRAVPILVKALESSDTDFRSSVISALAAVRPPNAETLGALIRQFSHADGQVRQRTYLDVAAIGPGAVAALVETAKNGEMGTRNVALMALYQMGNSYPDVPFEEHAVTVAGFLREDDRRMRITVYALGSIGPASRGAVPALIKLLASDDPAIRGAAIEALGQIGPDARGAVDELHRLLVDKDRTGLDVAEALGRIGSPAGGALAEGLSHPEPQIRVAAAKALRRISPAPLGALPQLTQRLQDADRKVRIEAAVTLWSMTGKIEPALPDLKAALKDDVNYATMIIQRIGLPVKETLPDLIRTVQETPDEFDQVSAANALGSFGPEAAEAVPALLEHAKTANFSLAEALGMIGRPAVPALVEALSADDPDVRAMAADALGRMGREAGGGLAALVPLLSDDERRVRKVVREAVESIAYDRVSGRSLPETLKAIAGDRITAAAFAALLNADGEDVQKGPASALVARASRQIPELIAQLAVAEGKERQDAAADLGRMGPHARPAAPALRDLLDDEDVYVRVNAAAALWSIGVAADAEQHLLLDGLKHPRERVRQDAAELLGELGPVAKSAIPHLLKVFDDPVPMIRVIAADALRKIDAAHPAVISAQLAVLETERIRHERWLAAASLGMLRSHARSAIPRLERAQLLEENGWVRDHIAKALHRIRAANAPAN